MALHDDLLELALRLIGPPPLPPAPPPLPTPTATSGVPAPGAVTPAAPPAPPPTEAELRRGISTAYYALFHLLIYAATDRGVATAALRAHVARNFEHRNMKAVCAKYVGTPSDKTGQPVPTEIHRIADAFVQLQESRHKADYNVKDPVTPVEARTSVLMARDAFTDWVTISTDPAADVFLTELLVGGIKDR